MNFKEKFDKFGFLVLRKAFDVEAFDVGLLRFGCYLWCNACKRGH